MKFSNPVIATLVILSGTETLPSEVSVESKDPYSLLRIRRDFLRGEVWR
jgi:hypothetical protein